MPAVGAMSLELKLAKTAQMQIDFTEQFSREVTFPSKGSSS